MLRSFACLNASSILQPVREVVMFTMSIRYAVELTWGGGQWQPRKAELRHLFLVKPYSAFKHIGDGAPT